MQIVRSDQDKQVNKAQVMLSEARIKNDDLEEEVETLKKQLDDKINNDWDELEELREEVKELKGLRGQQATCTPASQVADSNFCVGVEPNATELTPGLDGLGFRV